MAILEPIFNETVWKPIWLSESDAIATEGTETDQGSQIETPALRPPTNPFRLLMNKIDQLLSSNDPDEMRRALHMVHAALDDRQYSCDQEHLILSDRWLELTERLKPTPTAEAVNMYMQPQQHFMI
jgi:hypothetical protein